MKCSEFEEQLSAFLDGVLNAQERKAAIAHLESCPDCRQTTLIARGDFDIEPGNLTGDFVFEVLELTSGTTCRHARRYLCRLVDGELTAKYAEVVADHLRACRECSGLFVALTELAEVLPEMALLELDSSFTADVLARTTVAEEVYQPRNRIRRFLDSVFQRPRFSWEAAYIGTLLIMTVWGSAVTPVVLEKSSQRLASTQINLNRLAEDLQRTAADNWIADRAEQLGQDLTAQYFVWKQSTVDFVSDARHQIHEFPEKSSDYLEQKMEGSLNVLSDHLHELREKLGLERDTAGESLR